ncbi:Transient receptor potential cation channel subfamily A member 1 [Trichoplax sp. H2]|nr:Transient receptor potential cation channel subfamily A member 1 [Trichoplax sp. H2]|eukprot:RDD41599.1 Transient receptor potential cation channel subfamily A member 1 [Trichoplax sp. H2]
MIKPMRTIDEESIHHRSRNGLTNGKRNAFELQTTAESISNHSSIVDDVDIKVLKSPKIKRNFRTGFRRASIRNNLQTEILPACTNGRLKTLQEILDEHFEYAKNSITDIVNTIDDNLMTPLHYATIHDHIDVMQYLLSKGADIDALGGRLGRTPILVGTEFNRRNAVQELLNHDPDMSIKDSNGQQILHIVAQQGNVDLAKIILQKLVEKGLAFVNDIDDEHKSPIHFAVDHGRFGLTELLIQHGAQLCVAADDGSTPLHLAAYRKDLRIMRLLLGAVENQGKKGYLNIFDNEGKTALHIAIEMNHLEMVKLCLNYGASVMQENNLKPLIHIAAINGSIEIAKLLLQHHVQVSDQDNRDRTALHHAVLGYQTEMIQFLHSEGATLESLDEECKTPFLTAVENGFVNATVVLLNLGANISATDNKNRNCLHYACRHRDSTILAELFKYGAASSINYHDFEGCTPLLASASTGDLHIINTLLDNGANLTAVNKDGDTLLHLIAFNNGHELIKPVVNLMNTSININNGYGKTPLHLAAQAGYLNTVRILLNCGADVNNSDIYGNSALHYAAKENRSEVMKLLIEHHCNINITNRRRDTPLHLASKENALSAVRILLTKDVNVAIKNVKHQTCLDMAIDYENTDVGLELIRDKRWQELMDSNNKMGYRPMKRLIEKLPEVAQAVMDRCVTRSNHPPDHPDSFVTFNYKYLESSPHDPESVESQKKYLAVSSMVEHNRADLILHPLTVAYRMHKWRGPSGFLFYLHIFIYLLIVTIFVTGLAIDLLCNPTANRTDNVSALSGCEIIPVDFARQTPFITLAIGIIIFVAHIISFIYTPYEFVKKLSSNVMEMLIGLVAVIFAILSLIYGSNIVNAQAGAILAFTAMLTLILNLQSTKIFGQYIVMFLAVLKTVLRVMVLVIMVLAVFGISFQFAFNATQIIPFSEALTAILGMFVMFVGEINFYTTFEPRMRTLSPGHLVAIAILILSFMIVVNITLSNLLIGLAVGDINKLQKDAELASVTQELVMIYDCHNLIPLFLRKAYYKPIHVFKGTGPQGKLAKYMWSRNSQRASLLDCVKEQLTKTHHQYQNLAQNFSEDKKTASAMYDLVKELTKQNETFKKDNEYLKEMIYSIAQKVNAISPTQAQPILPDVC